MKYRIVQNIEGAFLTTEVEDIFAAAEVRGFSFVKLADRKSLRPELQGQPIFAELCGPMWDGDAVRYEDQRSYDILST
jgi:hypothetical protein